METSGSGSGAVIIRARIIEPNEETFLACLLANPIDAPTLLRQDMDVWFKYRYRVQEWYLDTAGGERKWDLRRMYYSVPVKVLSEYTEWWACYVDWLKYHTVCDEGGDDGGNT